LERLTMHYGKIAATMLAVFAGAIALTMVLHPG
jgi:hypothetical protein